MKNFVCLLLVLVVSQIVYGSEIHEMETIVVTAQKQEEDSQKIPISLSVIDKHKIEKTHTLEVTDMDTLVPGLKIRQNSNLMNLIAIRGIGNSSRNIGFDTRAGVYLDGVYLGQSPALNMILYDLKRVEVLRGPQGTLYGKNTVAGAINLITEKPDSDFETTAFLETGNDRFYHGQLTANVPVVKDKHTARLSISHFNKDGYYTNVYNCDDLETENITSFRTQVRSFFSDRTEFNLNVDGLFSDQDSTLGDPITDTFATAINTEAADEFEVSYNTKTPEKRKLYGISGTLDVDFDNNFLLTAISAFRHTKIDFTGDLDYSSNDFLDDRFIDTYDQFSQEIRLHSPEDTQILWLTGLYIVRQEAKTDRTAFFGNEIENTLIPGLVQENSIPGDGDVTTGSYAGFASGTYKWTAKLFLDSSLRYTYEKKDAEYRLDGSQSGVINIATLDFNDTYSDSALTPNAGFRYFFTDDITGYAKISTGFKSGGYNLDFLTENDVAAGIEYDKETVISHEIGVKSTLLNKKLTTSLSFFYAEYDDYQIHQMIDLGGGATAVTIKNAAEVTSRGMELEMVVKPVSVLTLDAGMSLLDAYFDKFPGGGRAGADASGNALPYAPDLTINIGMEYTIPVNPITALVIIRGDYFYSDDYYTQVSNVSRQALAGGGSVPFGRVDRYDLISAKITLASLNKGWNVFIWCKNLTDESYITDSQRDFFGTIFEVRGMPRTVGVGISYCFK